MARVPFTDRFVAGAKSPGVAQLEHFDAKTRGLCLRVTSGGRKTWSLVFTSPKNGRRARVTLGVYPTVGLAAARGKAIEARTLLEENRDPRDVLAGQRSAAMTVAELANSYLVKHVGPNLRTAKAVERRLRKNVIPVIGETRVSDLHRRDINRVLDRVGARGSPIEAARCFEDLRALLRWGLARGDMDHNPADGMRKPAQSAPRERTLGDEEIQLVWSLFPAALKKSIASQRVLKLCLITGQRIGEVAGMAGCELDLKKGVWTIPQGRVKNNHVHRVPLSDVAVALIEEAIADARESKFVFPNSSNDAPLSPHAVAKNLTRAQKATKERPQGAFAIPHWTAHDLRRTAATGMAALGVQPIVIGCVLNHLTVTKANVTFTHYVHHDYASEKRHALDLWAHQVMGVVAGEGRATILPLRRAEGA